MWPNPQETVDSVTFTEEIFNGKLHFLCIVILNDWLQGSGNLVLSKVLTINILSTFTMLSSTKPEFVIMVIKKGI